MLEEEAARPHLKFPGTGAGSMHQGMEAGYLHPGAGWSVRHPSLAVNRRNAEDKGTDGYVRGQPTGCPLNAFSYNGIEQSEPCRL